MLMFSVSRGFARVVLATGVVLLCLVGVSAGSAMASVNLDWSSPVPVDLHAQPTALTGISCPSTTECVGIDASGQEVTFNPQAPEGARTASVASQSLLAVDCISTAQCTGVDIGGEEVTFNPQSPAGATPTTVDTSGVPLSIACSSTAACTTVDSAGQEVTFNPGTGAVVSAQTIAPNSVLIAVACPPSTPGSCQAIDTGGTSTSGTSTGATFYTFGQASGNTTSVQSGIDATGHSPIALSCDSGSACVTVDTGGSAVAIGSGSPSAKTIDGSGSSGIALSGLSCASATSTTVCTAVDVNGSEVAFDPSTLNVSQPATHIDGNHTLEGVSCPATHQCTAVDGFGQEVTFDPTSPGTPTPVAIDGRTNLSALSCPSASQCTAVDLDGGEVTFSPGSAPAPVTGNVDPGASAVDGIACPSNSQCTAVDAQGQEVTFDPASPGSPTPASIEPGHALGGVACPTSTQCTAVDGRGSELTFNPQAPGSPAAITVDRGDGLVAVACPSATQCTAIDHGGDEVTFNPQSPGTPTVVNVDSSPALALACPTTTQCTAIDSSAQQVTFFPQSRSELVPRSIDAGSQLTAIACRTATGCVAVDAAGRALEGDPRGTGSWTEHPISGGSLPGVACPSATECVAIDSPGDAFTGISGPLPPVPGATGRPLISGSKQAGKVLAASTGSWSNGPTSYSYQWERCTAAGGRCAAIRGALNPTYKLVSGDVGHRIRVLVWAYNISGPGTPATSSLTRAVSPHVFLALKRGSLAGLRSGRPRLVVRLVTATGQQPVKTVTISLPGGLTLAHHATSGIRVTGTRRHFKFRLHTGSHKLEINCASRTWGVRISISASVLRPSHAFVKRARMHRLRSVRLGLIVTERYGGLTRTGMKARVI